jgi:hypothetical protein
MNLGGFHNSSRWLLSENAVIQDIESGNNNYYVSVGNRTVDVIIAEHEGRKYLKTTADGYSPDNLLSLNECSLQ